LAWKTSEQSLRSYFETFCAVNSVDIMKCKRTGQPRGFGFVVLSDPSMLELVCSLEHIIEDRKVEVKPHMTQREIMPNVEHTTTFKLFVGGLKGEAKDTDLVAYFSHYGEVNHDSDSDPHSDPHPDHDRT
jgi:RNA recognition motif-containing protein